LPKKNNYKKNLVLFFSRGISLQDWDSAGILSREIKIYVELVNRGWSVSFITYGNKSDIKSTKQLNGIDIYCNYLGLPSKWYESFLFLIHRRVFKYCDLIKTNQMKGSESVLGSHYSSILNLDQTPLNN
jgi:hypothetical protein